MKIALYQIGNFYDVPTTTRVFDSKETAMANIPKGFKKTESIFDDYYCENEKEEKWLSIKLFEVESEKSPKPRNQKGEG